MIPAGDGWHEVLAHENFKRDVYLLAVMPHMHLLGRDMRLVATTPEGIKTRSHLDPRLGFQLAGCLSLRRTVIPTCWHPCRVSLTFRQLG